MKQKYLFGALVATVGLAAGQAFGAEEYANAKEAEAMVGKAVALSRARGAATETGSSPWS